MDVISLNLRISVLLFEPYIGARHNDCFARAVGGRDWWSDEELVIEKSRHEAEENVCCAHRCS